MKITEKLGLKKPEPSDTFDVQDFNDNADILDKLWEIIYPVGAVYISTNAASPQDLFGGTWVQLENRFLLSAGSSYIAGNTGGSATHTLTVNEIPSHSHPIAYATDWSGAANVAGYSVTANPPGKRLGTSNTGGGAAHNNMPPYLVVYMWERTA